MWLKWNTWMQSHYTLQLSHISKLYNKCFGYSCKTCVFQKPPWMVLNVSHSLLSSLYFISCVFPFEGSRLGFACFHIMMVSTWRCLRVDEYEPMIHWPHSNELHKREPRASLPAFCLLLFWGLSTCPLPFVSHCERQTEKHCLLSAHNQKIRETKPYYPLLDNGLDSRE